MKGFVIYMTSERLTWVDTLRGVAVICVFLLHAMLDVKRYGLSSTTILPGLSVFEEIVFGFFDFGKIGVAIFFMVSGFLIPVTLNKPGQRVIACFSLNRFFRLFPAYWVSIVAFLFLLPTGLSFFQVATNFTMIQRFVGVPDLNGVYWTLQIELIFYSLCSILKWRGWLDRNSVPLISVCVFGVIALVLSFARFYFSLRLPVAIALALQLMFLGYLWRRWMNSDFARVSDVWKALVCICITLLVACPLAYSRDYGFGESWSRYLLSYCLAIAIFAIASINGVRLRWLSFLGKVSYSFYLIHTIVISVVVKWVFSSSIHTVGVSHLLSVIFISALVSVTVSWVLFEVVEEPGVRLGRAIVRAVRGEVFVLEKARETKR